MDDLISRQSAIDAVHKNYDVILDFTSDGQTISSSIEDILSDLPSTLPEQKKGKWIYKDDLKRYFCSECGYPSLTYDDMYIYGIDLPNFCEYCGADMRGERDG